MSYKKNKKRSKKTKYTFYNKIIEWNKHRQLKSEGKELVKELKRILKKKTKYALSDNQIEKVELLISTWKTALKEKKDLNTIVTKMETLLDSDFKKFKQNIILSYVKSFGFAAIFALSLRAFFFEPFKIPSGSMIPTLQIGDYIYVNKFIYGLRIPFTQHPPKHFVMWKIPKRGDIIVFIEPINQSEDWIKRVVALPGDKIRFDNRTIYLKRGGKGAWIAVPSKKLKKECKYMDKHERENNNWYPGRPCDLYEETLDGHTYNVIYDKNSRIPENYFPREWTVPKGYVFVMGDNRDNSEDSRFLNKNGVPHPFIPIENIKGKATFIWYSSGPNGSRWSRFLKGIF